MLVLSTLVTSLPYMNCFGFRIDDAQPVAGYVLEQYILEQKDNTV